MLNIYLIAFGLYLIAGILILIITRLLARHWRELTWSNIYICSISAAIIANVAFYCFIQYADQGNVGGGSGVGAIILVIVGLAVGGLLGLVVLFVIAGILSKKIITEPRLTSKAIAANGITFLWACLMVPALIILIKMFFDADGFFIFAFCGMCLGVAGLRESILFDEKLDNYVITNRLLWVGLLSSIIALLGICSRFLMTGSVLHGKNLLTLFIVSAALFIPIGIFAWRIRRASFRSSQAPTEKQMP